MQKHPTPIRLFLTTIASVTLTFFMTALPHSPSQAATIGIPEYQPQQPPGTESYQKGMVALTKGNFQTAKRAFQEVIDEAPTHVGAYLGLAEIAWNEKDHEKVGHYLQKALKLAPKNAMVYQAWGKHLIQQGRFIEAEDALKKGIWLEPKQVSLHVQLGDLYLQLLREPKQAIKAYHEALILDVSHAGAHYGLGMAHFALRQVPEAKTALKEATRLTPKNPLPYYSLGRLYMTQQTYDQALDAFSTAIRLQPKFLEAHIAKGDVYINQQKDEEALKSYERAKSLAPNVGGIYVKLGLVHERNERIDEAVEAFEQAISLDPNQAIAFNNLAWIATQKNSRLDEALEWAKKAVELAPKVSAFQDTLGWVHRLRGELDEAADALYTASLIKPELPDIYYHLGIVEAERGNKKNAISALTRALELDEHFAGAGDAQERIDSLNSQ